MARVFAPNKAYNGTTAGVRFANGVADTDDADALAYLARAGYGVDEYKAAPSSTTAVDARDAGDPIPIGTRLRDAAVDPRASDFLPPTNAGEADPHGPDVVSPQIHGSETGPIVAGRVAVTDPALQEAKETAADEDVFVEGQEVDAIASIDQPAASASKAAWVEFAVGRGMPRETAEDMTKAELQLQLAE
jgi:hypothetical protein